MIRTAMVMAAGHGTRMRPLTNDRSKAMVEVGGKPLIDHTLDRLVAAGVETAIINVHAHADHLEAHLRTRRDLKIVISDERSELLETGGGLVKALPLLGNDPVFICNIDAVWIGFEDVLGGMISAWDAGRMDELFLLAQHHATLGFDGAGDFEARPDGRLIRRRGARAPYIYAGVEIFKPDLAIGYEPTPFSRNLIWDETIKRGRVCGHVLPGYWMHVGDPRAVIAAEAVLKQSAHD